jgi:hypothetical protein
MPSTALNELVQVLPPSVERLATDNVVRPANRAAALRGN